MNTVVPNLTIHNASKYNLPPPRAAGAHPRRISPLGQGGQGWLLLEGRGLRARKQSEGTEVKGSAAFGVWRMWVRPE